VKNSEERGIETNEEMGPEPGFEAEDSGNGVQMEALVDNLGDRAMVTWGIGSAFVTHGPIHRFLVGRYTKVGAKEEP